MMRAQRPLGEYIVNVVLQGVQFTDSGLTLSGFSPSDSPVGSTCTAIGYVWTLDCPNVAVV